MNDRFPEALRTSLKLILESTFNRIQIKNKGNQIDSLFINTNRSKTF
jgi:hypothetical protein